MAHAKRSDVYEALVNISEEFFGPASKRFVSRLIINHLHKQPEELEYKDVTDLVQWLSLALCIVSDDTDAIDAYVEQVRRLG